MRKEVNETQQRNEPMKVFFDTREFERSHGKKPRGTGCWAFMPENSGNPEDWVFAPSMSFTAAKAFAKDQRPDVQDWSVGP